MPHLLYIPAILILLSILLVQAKRNSSTKNKRRGLIQMQTGRIERFTERQYDVTNIAVEVVELERFNNGFSKIKILNVSGTLDPRQDMYVRNSVNKIIETENVQWFK